jgi:Flp pilus assembly protein TadD
MAFSRNELRQAAAQHARGEIAQAEAKYRELLTHAPGNAELLHLIGVAALQQNRKEEAVDLMQQAVQINPKIAEYHNNLGIALDALDRREESVASYREALKLKPVYPEAHNNLAGTLAMVGNLDEAIAEYQIAVEQNPNYAEAWDNLGSTLRLARRNDESMAAHNKAIELKPDFAYAHFNRGTLYLATGEFQKGWEDLEWRWKCPTFGHPQRDFGKPMWAGEDLHGKTILFHSEQGLGDVLQFVRYASILADRGARVIVEAQEELYSLLPDVPGVSVAFKRGEQLPEFDYHIPMMSVPRVVQTTLETIPADMPYILPPAMAHENWRTITRQDARAEGQKKLRVGLAWAGNPKNLIDRRRSIPLSMLAPLGAAPNVRFYSLQVGPAAAQTASSSFPIIDHSAKLTDFVETAGLIANMDLVICVETAVAHLAGAMNQKTWLLMYEPPDWRWMFDREDSPWYPSIRIFRQKTPRNWEDPINEIAEKLRELGQRLG